MSQTRPSVLFVCVHNAGRSQMAAAWTQRALRRQAVEVRSAGSAPADSINPAVREVTARAGDRHLGGEARRSSRPTPCEASDVVITMGCGDTCPFFPGKRYLDWVLEDPAGQGVAAVRPIRDEIRRRVSVLLRDLGIEPARGDAPTA
jgi:arsenate reductase